MIQTTKLSALALASLAAAYAPMGGFLPRALVSVEASGSEAQPQGAQPQGAQPQGAQPQGAGQEEAGPPLPPQEPVGARPSDPAADRAKLIAAFQEMGIILADDADALGFSARVEVLNELLEYLLTTPQGASHESMFLTDVSPDGLTAAMLALGVGQGDNVQYVAKDPPPTREEARNGVPTHEVIVPSGGETYLYAAWRESSGARDATTGEFPGETLHFHRMEDLLLDLVRGRTMRRHPWVWLGSRMVQDRGNGGGEVLAAASTGNLVNVAFFSQGDTLVTAALPECTVQTGWRPNVWLLPDRGAEILFIMSTDELDGLPDGLRAAAPFVPEPVGDSGGR